MANAPLAFVPKPPGNGRDIDAALNADRGEKMAEIVVRDSSHANDLGGTIHGLLTLANGKNRVAIFVLWTLTFEAVEQ